jgi:hypothetical protein
MCEHLPESVSGKTCPLQEWGSRRGSNPTWYEINTVSNFKTFDCEEKYLFLRSIELKSYAPLEDKIYIRIHNSSYNDSWWEVKCIEIVLLNKSNRVIVLLPHNILYILSQNQQPKATTTKTCQQPLHHQQFQTSRRIFDGQTDRRAGTTDERRTWRTECDSVTCDDVTTGVVDGKP